MKKPFSVRIAQNLIFTSSLSILPTSIATYLIFKNIKNPQNNTLLNTNKIMGGIHLIAALTMYFLKPVPKKNELIGFNQCNLKIVIDEFINLENDVDLKQKYLDDNIWHVYSCCSKKISLYKKIITVNDELDEATYTEYNLFLLRDLNTKKYKLFYTKNLDDDSLNKILENKNYNFELVSFDLKDMDWGVQFIYKQKKYIINESYKIENIAPVKFTNIPIWNTSAFFSLITSLFHFNLGYNSKLYLNFLNKKRNPFRWIEYFFSSGIMMANFAALAKIDSKNDLINTFALTAVTNIFGMAIDETIISKQKILQKVTYFINGLICFTIPFYMVQNNYSGLIDKVYEGFGEKKNIYLINFIEMANKRGYLTLTRNLPYTSVMIGSLYLIFPIIQIFQVLYPDKYKLGELLFIYISLISKLTLNVYAYYEGSRTNEQLVRN